jgi:hypothetical protein
MKYLYEMQDSLAFFKTQIMNLELLLFLQMDCPLGMGFLCLQITLNGIDCIFLVTKQDHVYLCHVSCHLCLAKE